MHIGNQSILNQYQKEGQFSNPNQFSERSSSPPNVQNNPHLAFQKNYPKNIFIPMIQHLHERGLQKQCEQCVGTRESFQGKNVVSLAEIYKLMSQAWFSEGINLVVLISSMSNKILMNSKIKKKLFHLLLIRELFNIPVLDVRQFKKMVSKKANQVSYNKLSDDRLFNFPSALIYLLNIFAQGLQPNYQIIFPTLLNNQLKLQVGQQQQNIFEGKFYGKKLGNKQLSSKIEYKFYLTKIISSLNQFQGQSSQLLDLLQSIKQKISEREYQLRNKYALPSFVPEWSYFNQLVINNCYLIKRNKIRLTYSLLNNWIQQFKDKGTSFRGLIDIVIKRDVAEPQRQYIFTPIIIKPPPR